MSRETFIQSEDKELEVTFREVRNWDEYADLDFEADTAPLTEQEAGTDSEDELPEEFTVADSNKSDVVAEEESEEPPVTEDENVDEDVDVDNGSDEVEQEEETDVESESGEESDAEEATEEGYASDTSQEAVVTLPVVEDNFEAEPAWEEPVTGDEDEETVLVDEESAEDEELPLGEKGEDTESLGDSLEAIYNLGEVRDNETYNLGDVAYVDEDETEESKTQTLKDIVDEAIESGEPVLVGTVRENGDYTIGNLNFEKTDDSVSEESDSPVEYAPIYLDIDPNAINANSAPEGFVIAEEENTEVDTFEAISSEGESLNKAETVEELPAVYSEDTLPDTVAIETVDSGDYFSFDDVELDSDEDKAEEKEETPVPVSEESKDADSDEDDELSLELDYSEDEDN